MTRILRRRVTLLLYLLCCVILLHWLKSNWTVNENESWNIYSSSAIFKKMQMQSMKILDLSDYDDETNQHIYMDQNSEESNTNYYPNDSHMVNMDQDIIISPETNLIPSDINIKKHFDSHVIPPDSDNDNDPSINNMNPSDTIITPSDTNDVSSTFDHSIMCPPGGKRWVLNTSLDTYPPKIFFNNWNKKFRHHSSFIPNGMNFDTIETDTLLSRSPIPLYCPKSPLSPQLSYRFFCHERSPSEFTRVWNMQKWTLESCDINKSPSRPSFSAEEFIKNIVSHGGMLIVGDSISLQHFISLVCALGKHTEFVTRTSNHKYFGIIDKKGQVHTDHDRTISTIRLKKSSPLYSILSNYSTTKNEINVISYVRDDFLANSLDFKINMNEHIQYPDLRYRALREYWKASLRRVLNMNSLKRSSDYKYNIPEYVGFKRLSPPKVIDDFEPPAEYYGIFEFNTAAHWIPAKLRRPDLDVIKAYKEMVDEFIEFIEISFNDNNISKPLIIIRNSPPTNPECQTQNQPAIDPKKEFERAYRDQNKRNQKKIHLNIEGEKLIDYAKEQNSLRVIYNSYWKEKISYLHSNYPKTQKYILFYDIEEFSFLRPDGHSVIVKDKPHKVDCLHYCIGAGIIEEWTRELYILLKNFK